MAAGSAGAESERTSTTDEIVLATAICPFCPALSMQPARVLGSSNTIGFKWMDESRACGIVEGAGDEWLGMHNSVQFGGEMSSSGKESIAASCLSLSMGLELELDLACQNDAGSINIPNSKAADMEHEIWHETD